jgi:hypothetical protein
MSRRSNKAIEAILAARTAATKDEDFEIQRRLPWQLKGLLQASFAN